MAILAAVDGGKNSGNVTEVGYDLSSTYDVDLYVLHVMSESAYESRADSSPEYYRDDAREDAAIVAEAVVEDALGSPGGVRSVGRVGDPADEVLAFADEVGALYLVTGGRRRSPVGKAVFGSDAQQILLNSALPVVTVMGPTNAPE